MTNTAKILNFRRGNFAGQERRPLNRAQALAKIAEIKAKFGLKGASV